MTTAGHVVENKRLEVCAPHPSELLSRETTDLLSSIATVPVIAVGPPKAATSLGEIVDAMEEKRRSLGVERWVIWGMSGGSFLGQLYAHHDARPWLGTIRAPTLVLCGTADPVVPLRHAETLAALMPNAHFVAIDGAGHIPLTDHRRSRGVRSAPSCNRCDNRFARLHDY